MPPIDRPLGRLFPLLVCTTLFALPALPQRRGGGGAPVDLLQFRFMGPAVGNRIASAAGIPGDPSTYYAGAASGGVWKSTDSGKLRAGLRQPTGEGHRRAGSLAVRSQHRLGGHRRSVGHPRQRHDGRRRLQVHRRGADLDPHGAHRDRPHRPHHRESDKSRYRLRVRGGPPDRSAAGARRLQDHRRRKELERVAVRRSQHRLLRPLDGCERSEHAGRRHVASGDAHLGDVQRRAGQRRVYHARRRRHLEAHRRARHAEISGRQDRRGHRAQQFQAHLRADPDRRPGLGLALRRRRRELGRRELAARADRARRLLHPHHREPGEPGRGAGGQQQLLALDRRRQVVPQRAVGRRHARYLDRPRRQAHHRDARWRHVHHHRSRPEPGTASRDAAHRADVPRGGGQRRAVSHLRQHAGRRHDARPEHYPGGRAERAGPGRPRRLRPAAAADCGSTAWAAANRASRFPTSPTRTSSGPRATATK